MTELLPSEYWEYGLADAAVGMLDALLGRVPDPFIAIPGLGDCIPTRSARSAIMAAIEALELPKEGRIGVPLYCCPAVFKAVVAAGRRLRFVDVDPATCCMSTEDVARKIDDLDAIIGVHMFGNLCDIPGLVMVAGGKPVIEDCAQAIGSLLGGSPAGSFGAVSVFSFRSGKYLSVGEGGAVYAPDEALRSHIAEIVSSLPVPGRAEECRHVLATCVRSMLRRKPLYGLVGRRLWAAYNSHTAFASKTPIAHAAAYATDCLAIERRMASLPVAIARRRGCAEYYARTLQVEPRMLCEEGHGERANRYLYPVMLPTSSARDALVDYLREHGIDSATPYHDIASIARENYGYTGDCPAAERVAQRVLILPSHNGLRTDEMEYVARCFNEGWKKLAGAKEATSRMADPTGAQPSGPALSLSGTRKPRSA